MHETLEPEEQQRSRNWGGARAGAGRPVTKPVHDLRVAMMAGAINSDYAKDLPSLAASGARRSAAHSSISNPLGGPNQQRWAQ